MVEEKSRLYPRMLIAPGTVFWIDRNGNVRNSMPVFCRSENIAMLHHKKLSLGSVKESESSGVTLIADGDGRGQALIRMGARTKALATNMGKISVPFVN
jgi:hypothetical protein